MAVNYLCRTICMSSISFRSRHQTTLLSSSNNLRHVATRVAAACHTTPGCNVLMEFFDEKKYWGVNEVKSGRSWLIDELRLKSNEDLHKLWYVLIKERNMLKTMEHHAKVSHVLFPNPERIDKIEDSMDRLERVVMERNKAYHMLETGETGEQPEGPLRDPFGRKLEGKYQEHVIPMHENAEFLEETGIMHKGDVQEFLALYNEKEHNRSHHEKLKQKREVAEIFKHFPDVDIEALKEKYPDINVERVRKTKYALGNHDKNIA